MIVINLFGGPGAGKSTMAARVFSELKEQGYNAELVTEYAKDLTWQKSMKVLDNQMYVFAKQHHRLWRIKDDVDIAITDSPLVLSLVYGTTSETFKKLVLEEFHKFENYNVLLRRVKKYNPKGRNQTLEEAKEIDEKVRETMREYEISMDLRVDGNKLSTDIILNRIEAIWNSSKH